MCSLFRCMGGADAAGRAVREVGAGTCSDREEDECPPIF